TLLRRSAFGRRRRGVVAAVVAVVVAQRADRDLARHVVARQQQADEFVARALVAELQARPARAREQAVGRRLGPGAAVRADQRGHATLVAAQLRRRLFVAAALERPARPLGDGRHGIAQRGGEERRRAAVADAAEQFAELRALVGETRRKREPLE